MKSAQPAPSRACGVADDVLGAYVDGEGSAATAESIRTHLRSCAVCLAEARALSALNTALRAEASVGVPAGLWDDIEAAMSRADAAAASTRPRRIQAGWLASVGLVAGIALLIGVLVWPALFARDVVTASVQDFITYRAKGWTVDVAGRSGRDLASWAQARVAFAVPELKSRIGPLEIGGVRLCWLLDRRLLGVTYQQGDVRAVLYVMEASGLALPAADRTLSGGRRVAIEHRMGHGVAVWAESDLAFVLVAADPDFARLLEVARSGAMPERFLATLAQWRRPAVPPEVGS